MDKKRRDNTVIVFIVVLLFGGLLLWWAIQVTSKKDKVDASIFSYHAVDNSTLSVEYRVTNNTSRAGKSTCSITMGDAASNYSGYDSGFNSAYEISPGETYSGTARLTITNEGAEYVTKGGITCEIAN